jgi:hypothetical protein
MLTPTDSLLAKDKKTKNRNMVPAGPEPRSRAARRYMIIGDTAKAAAHFGRAMHYDEPSVRFPTGKPDDEQRSMDNELTEPASRAERPAPIDS